MNAQGKYLKFEDPTILKFDFQINDDFDYEISTTDTDINTLVEIPTDDDIDSNNDIPVYLTVYINEDTPNAPYVIRAKIFTLFSVSEVISQIEMPLILQNEGASILLSYLRPIVSMMTSASGFPAMTLPMLDFSDDD